MSKVRWDLYSAADGKPLAGSDGVAAASQEYPNDTRYAATQRRAFVRGFAQGRGAGRAVQDDGLPTVEALAQAMWDALSDNGILRIDADRPKELNDIAATIHRRLRATPPLHDPEDARE